MPDADRLNQNYIVACRLAHKHGLSTFASDAAESAARGRRSDECFGATRQSTHAGFVAEDRALCDRTGGIDGEHRYLMTFVAKHIAERLNEGRLACAGHACDADAECSTGFGQESLKDALSLAEVFGVIAFDESDGARENDAIAARNSVDELIFG